MPTESGLRLLNAPAAGHREIRPAAAYGTAAREEFAKFLSEGADRTRKTDRYSPSQS
ncbi:hypothetical protein HYE82_19290 [Streptomyces sp. BR123]|jgi:hypothetical protein|uniref:hypothetical protein n=1 Tax=Streptomyces sp. BR123 TaxID=2749828 RepID=UPI0015C48E21|nr:hypothetical protein [Streptomyces sp. BR123]NXY96495.1 hypothetical protein [Streptomyces sp. BR123]